MSTGKKLHDEMLHPLNSTMLACPTRGACTSFQLVDEFGSGSPYAGSSYEACDIEGETYRDFLDMDGKGEIKNHFIGPIILRFISEYIGDNDLYTKLQTRDN